MRQSWRVNVWCRFLRGAGRLRFKIDENLPVEAAELLVESGHDARTIHDQQMVGERDLQVVSVSRDESRALITLDLDFADIRAYPPSDYHGLIVLRPKSQSKPAVVALVQRLLPALNTEPLEASLWIVDETKIRIRQGDADDGTAK
jgi:predicted nuclease of predicted toxin-antitoxin system